MCRDLKALEEEIRSFTRRSAPAGAGEEEAPPEEGRLRLFLLHYIHGQSGHSLENSGPRDVIDFVGTWYLRHVANASDDSVLATLQTLAEFFRWRASRGKLREDALREILRACEDESFYLARLAEYRRSVGDEDAFDTWLEKRWGWVETAAPVKPRVASALSPDPDLLGALLRGSLPSLASDFDRLLGAIRETPLRLNRSGRRLVGSAVSALNRRLPDPDTLPPRPRQEDAPRVNAAYSAAMGLELCRPEKGLQVRVLPTLDSILGMGGPERYALLLDTLWNVVPWDDLVSTLRRDRPVGLQDGRSWLAKILAIFPVDEEVILRGKVSPPRQRLAEMLEGEAGLFRCLLPVLERGGIWVERLSGTAGGRRSRRRLISLSITPLGHAILEVWGKTASKQGPPAPLDELLPGPNGPATLQRSPSDNGK